MKKRFLCLALALTMTLGNIGTTEAFASVSPVDLYAGLERLASYSADGTEQLHRAAGLRSTSVSADTPTAEQVAAAPLFASTTEAGAYLRTQMKQRTADVILRVSGDYDDETISVFHEAIRHTGISDEGDALDCQRDTTKAGAWQNASANECVYRYTFTYRTTLEEEQELKEALKRIEAEIPWGSTADEEMHAIRGVYRYLIETYSYDYDSYEKHKQNISKIAQDKTAAQSYTAYGTYKNQKAVCQGLAELLYRILLDRGIDTRILHSDTHAWNAVEVEDEWYMCDAAGDVQKGFKDVPEHYLISRTELAELGNVYNWNADTVWDYTVVDAYDWAARDWYDLTASVLRDFKKVVKLVKGNKTGKQKATLTDANGNKLKEGKDYTVSYEYGNYKDGKYNSKVIYTGKGNYSGTVEKYYNRTMEAPKIVKVEQRVVDLYPGEKDRYINQYKRYKLETCIYVKMPVLPPERVCDETTVYFSDKTRETHVYYIKPHKPGNWKMKDGTIRYVFYNPITTKPNTQIIKDSMTSRFQITTYVGLKGVGAGSIESWTNVYSMPSVKGSLKANKKKVYTAKQIKKMAKDSANATNKQKIINKYRFIPNGYSTSYENLRKDS